MSQFSPRVIFLLGIPALLWAGNAVVGRMMVGTISPILFNTVRWALAGLILLPFGWRVLRSESPLWRLKGRFAVMGLLGIGCYNTFQYLALQTSTPINVTLIGASMPVWSLLIGAFMYQEIPSRRQMLGAAISLLGVAVVLSRGELAALWQVKFVIGDLFMLLAVILWGIYSWMLSRPGDSSERSWDWTEFLLAQIVFGLSWSVLFTGIEITQETLHFEASIWAWALILYVAIGPAIVAYRCWSLGVQKVGANVAAFVGNLIPLFAALMSAALLREMPQIYHGIAFILIVCGIALSLKKS